GRIEDELAARNAVEQQGRDRLGTERDRLRTTEQGLQQHAELHRRLTGEQGALDSELGSLAERIAQEEAHREQLAADHQQCSERLAEAREVADQRSDESHRGSAAAEQARLLLRETRDREARELAERRAIEEELGTVTARRSALDALERDGVGIAPATAALMAARSRYGDRI